MQYKDEHSGRTGYPDQKEGVVEIHWIVDKPSSLRYKKIIGVGTNYEMNEVDLPDVSRKKLTAAVIDAFSIIAHESNINFVEQLIPIIIDYTHGFQQDMIEF